MKNFCPNCGTPLKADAEFCPNCGTKIKKLAKVEPNVSAPTPMPPKKPKKNNNVKIIVGALLAIVVICVAVFVVIYHNESSNTQNEAKSAMTHKGKKKEKSTDQTVQTSSSQENSDNYSNDEWMLMGYMAYAYDNYVESDDISNDSELVDAVEDDLSNGDLEVSKNSDTNYTLTNKYGSVDVDVDSDDVEVSNDGDTTTAKSELEKKFSSYKDQLQKMSSYIKNGSSSSDDNDDSDSDSSNSKTTKTSIPGDEGLFTVPSNMQGTWYGYVDNLEMKNSTTAIDTTFGQHTVSEDDGDYELHLQSKDFYKTKSHNDKYINSKEGKQTLKQIEKEKILATYTVNSAGIKGFCTTGWAQTSHFHTYYAPYILKGQKVILSGSMGSGNFIRQILWKTPELAKKYRNTKFPEVKEISKKLSTDPNYQ